MPDLALPVVVVRDEPRAARPLVRYPPPLLASIVDLHEGKAHCIKSQHCLQVSPLSRKDDPGVMWLTWAACTCRVLCHDGRQGRWPRALGFVPASTTLMPLQSAAPAAASPGSHAARWRRGSCPGRWHRRQPQAPARPGAGDCQIYCARSQHLRIIKPPAAG